MSAMDQDQQWILLLFLESRREGEETVNGAAGFVGEPELPEFRPI